MNHDYRYKLCLTILFGLLISIPLQIIGNTKPMWAQEETPTPTSEINSEVNSENISESDSEEKSEETPDEVPSLISPETATDYTPLKELLAGGKWREADRKTRELMLIAIKRESEGTFALSTIGTFPCTDLKIINQLWHEYSETKFSFNTQKELYIKSGNTPGKVNVQTFDKFGELVGWKEGLNWLNYNLLTFDNNAPKGHLPRVVYHRKARSSSGGAPNPERIDVFMERFNSCLTPVESVSNPTSIIDRGNVMDSE